MNIGDLHGLYDLRATGHYISDGYKACQVLLEDKAREYNELSDINQELMYIIRQMETVLRLKEIEIAEMQMQIAHLQKVVARDDALLFGGGHG